MANRASFRISLHSRTGFFPASCRPLGKALLTSAWRRGFLRLRCRPGGRYARRLRSRPPASPGKPTGWRMSMPHIGARRVDGDLHGRGHAETEAGRDHPDPGAAPAVSRVFAIQLAKHLGARVITTQVRRTRLSAQTGADEIIDYNAVDFTRSCATASRLRYRRRRRRAAIVRGAETGRPGGLHCLWRQAPKPDRSDVLRSGPSSAAIGRIWSGSWRWWRKAPSVRWRRPATAQ